MGAQPEHEKERGEEKSNEREELRTIGFRLRELQRLLSMRVQQENRRLEADGIDPITEATFFKHPDEQRSGSEQNEDG
jgi:hypothetical protein